jgi:hypothetical protein
MVCFKFIHSGMSTVKLATGSLSHSQSLATCPYPEPDQFIPYPHSICWISVLILSKGLSKSKALQYLIQHVKCLLWGTVTPSPKPQAGKPPLVDCPLHPQPGKVTCHGDRDPFITGFKEHQQEYNCRHMLFYSTQFISQTAFNHFTENTKIFHVWITTHLHNGKFFSLK